MRILLSTQPQFLHQHFSRVRSRLRGPRLPRQAVGQRLVSKLKDRSGGRDLATRHLSTNKNSRKMGRKYQSWGQRMTSGFLSLVIVASILVTAAVAVPAFFYTIFPADVIEIGAATEGTPLGGRFDDGAIEEVRQEYVPPVDITLPEGDWIIIPRIGVRTQLQATAQASEALETGVWLVPDFGRPGDKDLPMIAAAHRYGWQWWWKSDYWKYHSFNKLPELEPGDLVEVISGQQKWIYEIYAGEEGEEITDYSADLILYTCKFLKGPLRHFRYARLVDPTADTQVWR
jgi:hypothetical protein